MNVLRLWKSVLARQKKQLKHKEYPDQLGSDPNNSLCGGSFLENKGEEHPAPPHNFSPPCLKNLLMPLFLMGCFPVDFQEVKRPLRTISGKRPIKVGKRPISEGKRPIKAEVLVGVSVGCLMGFFRAPPPWQKTAPLKRPIKRSMRKAITTGDLERPNRA